MNNSDFKYMVEATAADLATFLSEDYELSVNEALDTLYNSETYSKLTDPRSGLYFQSSRYVYSFLKNELATGKLA